MAAAKSGDRVKVHYTGRLRDGTVFDSTEGREPLEFQLGEGRVIAGFEDAVQGMSPGDTKSVSLSPGEAYGPRRDEMVVAIDRERVPDDFNPQVGQRIELRGGEGQIMPAMIVEVTDQAVTVDANHPLAGQELQFDIDLVEVG